MRGEPRIWLPRSPECHDGLPEYESSTKYKKEILKRADFGGIPCANQKAKKAVEKVSFSSEKRARRHRRDPGELGTRPEIAFSAPGAVGNPESTPKSSFSTPPLAPRSAGEANSTCGAKAASPNNDAVLAQASHRIKKLFR